MGVVLVVATAALAVSGGVASAQAPSPTVAPTTTTPPAPPTTPPHGPGPVSPGSTPTSAPVSTSVPPAPTTTVDPQVLNALLHAIQNQLAQLDAITGYDHDKGIVTVNQANAASADSDADLAARSEGAALAAEAAARSALDSAVHRLSAIAVALYVRADFGAKAASLNPGTNALVNRNVILGMLVDHGREQVVEGRRQLRAYEALLTEARQRAASARHSQATAHLVLTRSANELANAKLAAAGRAVQASIGTPLPTITGPAALSAGELAGWFATRGFAANTTVPIQELASLYVGLGTTETLRGDIAFAQSIIETGYFTFPTGGQVLGSDNNFAGIGACDTCAHGWRFPDARTGVAAQLQLLHAYASPKRIPTPLVGRVGVAGCCPTWLSLAGVWATATNYGYAILTVYKQMLDWAIPQRLAAAGL